MTELEIQERQAHLRKVDAEIAKLIAETSKINRERFWIPMTVFAGVIVAIVTILPRLFP